MRRFFLQINVYLNKRSRYSVYGCIWYLRTGCRICHAYMIGVCQAARQYPSVKRTGSTASPKQSGDHVKTRSLVFRDNLGYESSVFNHLFSIVMMTPTHNFSVSIYYPWLLKHCITVMDPTILQRPLPLFLIRLWRKSRTWNPFIMKIVVTSTCRRIAMPPITHLSRGFVERVSG